jgi:thiamine biosynthesis lipoprotein
MQIKMDNKAFLFAFFLLSLLFTYRKVYLYLRGNSTKLMIKPGCLLGFFLLNAILAYAQHEPVKLAGNAQGTTYHITYYDNESRDFHPEIKKILEEFDQSVSTYLPTSIISRINSNQKNVIVDKYFIACFNKAKEVWKNTGGAFDPTVYPLVNAWGFGPGKKEKIEKAKIDSILKFVGFHLMELKGNKVIKKDPRVALDFNAFAQGYSVDVVSAFLNSKGINSYIVEIGGEVYAKGKKPNGDHWTIGIEKPIENKESVNPLKAIAKLENLACATSGNYRRFIIEDGIRYAHHIDPKTGYPTKNNLLSASIFAKECISSDANATGVLVMGLEKAKVFLKEHPELQAYLIYSDDQGNYQVYETSGLGSIVTEAE